MRFSRLFSSSSSRSRFISDGMSPDYFFFQLKYVAWLMPAFRQISDTGTPPSRCFTANAFCASVNRDAFMSSLQSNQPETQAKTLTSIGSVFGVQTTIALPHAT